MARLHPPVRCRAWLTTLWLGAWLAAVPAWSQDPEPLPPPELEPQEPVPPPDDPPGDPPAPTDPAVLVDRALQVITPQSIMAHLGVLASDDFKGREAGTPESRRAAAYVEAQFRRAGCEPLGDDGTFFQPLPIPGRLAPTADTAGSVLAGDRELGWIPDVDCRPFGKAPNPAADGPLVFCGYGVSAPDQGYDDFADQDLHGKIALILRYTPRYGHPQDPFPGSSAIRHAALATKVRLAARQGAVGVVLVTGPERPAAEQAALDAGTMHTTIPAMQVTAAAMDHALQRVGLSLSALQAPITAGGRPASRPLPVIVHFRAALDEVNTLTHNVIGVLRGRDPALASQALVIGGHYDHVGFGHFGSRSASAGDIHNGADDNASGTSGVIALARTMHELGYRPRRSIVFMAFGAEEKGLLGSRYYCRHPTWPLADTVTMINLDMIGRGANDWCSANGVGTSPGFRTLVERLNQKVGLDLAFSEGGMAPSDNTWFYKNNIPVLFFFTGTHPEYHSPGDDVELIERESLAKVVRLAFLCAYVLAEADDRPEFRRHDVSEIPRLRDPGQTRRRKWLGLDCDPRSDPAGVLVRGVDPGSPAALAFVAAGDRITQVGPLGAPTAAMLETVLQRMHAGDHLTLGIAAADGSTRSVVLTLSGPFAPSAR